jgi:hypothetical protein
LFSSSSVLYFVPVYNSKLSIGVGHGWHDDGLVPYTSVGLKQGYEGGPQAKDGYHSLLLQVAPQLGDAHFPGARVKDLTVEYEGSVVPGLLYGETYQHDFASGTGSITRVAHASDGYILAAALVPVVAGEAALAAGELVPAFRVAQGSALLAPCMAGASG